MGTRFTWWSLLSSRTSFLVWMGRQELLDWDLWELAWPWEPQERGPKGAQAPEEGLLEAAALEQEQRRGQHGTRVKTKNRAVPGAREHKCPKLPSHPLVCGEEDFSFRFCATPHADSPLFSDSVYWLPLVTSS